MEKTWITMCDIDSNGTARAAAAVRTAIESTGGPVWLDTDGMDGSPDAWNAMTVALRRAKVTVRYDHDCGYPVAEKAV